MQRLLIILSTLFIISYNLFGQTNDLVIREQVLAKSIIDSVFVFGKWTEDGKTETHLKYLGQVRTKDGRLFKIMNYCLIWGQSHRATNRILIYDNKNKYVGNYYVTTAADLPYKLENGMLIFTNSDNDDCDNKLVTRVNLTNGIPREIMIKCKGEAGDIYQFSNE